MYKGKIDKLINEINKIARLKRISYKLENIYEEYDEYIEDYYFMEWLRMSQDGITQIEELNNMLELFEQTLEELEIAIYNAEDKVDIICNSILAYNKKELGDYINDFELYNDNYIKDTIMNFIENNMYEIDEDYLFLELEKLLEGGIGQIKDGLINSVNVSGSAWRKGITVCNNTLENQVIKIIENKKILEFKRWQVLIKKVLVFLLQKYPKYYDFINLKYFQKQSKDEIEETLKFDFKKQKIIKDKLIEFMYKNAKMRNLV